MQIPLNEGIGGERRFKDRVKTGLLTDNSIVLMKININSAEVSNILIISLYNDTFLHLPIFVMFGQLLRHVMRDPDVFITSLGFL